MLWLRAERRTAGGDEDCSGHALIRFRRRERPVLALDVQMVGGYEGAQSWLMEAGTGERKEETHLGSGPVGQVVVLIGGEK